MLLNYLHAFALSLWGGSFASFLLTLVDLTLVWFFFYIFLVRSKGTRTIHILVGFFLLVVLYGVGDALELRATEWLLSGFFKYFIIIAVVIFKDEIRDILMSMDRFGITDRTYGISGGATPADEIANAISHLADKREGALVIIKQQGDPTPFITGGVELDAIVKKELLLAIFNKHSPLHDGAVIIDGDRLVKAGTVLPLTTNPEIDPNFGTRHRAAYGISERVDSIVLVVSEERGQISMLRNGQISRSMTKDYLVRVLNDKFSPEKRTARKRGAWFSWFGGKKGGRQ